MVSYRAKILEILNETPRVKLFRLERNGMGFEPGQFITASIDGIQSSGIPVKRSYSIASTPLNTNYIELCITRAEKGIFSTAMHELEEGDYVNVNGPYGAFKLKKPTEDWTAFIAGGSGIAPIMSMLRTLLSGNSPKLTLFFGFRTPEDCIYRNELRAWRREGKLELYETINTPAEGWKGETGYVTETLARHAPETKSDAYVCGPPPMVAATIRKLTELGWPEARIHREQW